MTKTFPSLANADWLVAPQTQRIFALLAGAGEEARVIGGAVRNALLGVPVHEVDFATTATPEQVTDAAEAADIKVVPTGIEHGTLTLVVDGRGFEVTTLREDIETDGRHAVVRFGRDWEADARRRDFTINALSVDSVGTVHDPVGGYGDILERRVRFIGDADRRIAEDRLRILRFFRFRAEYGEGPIDADGLSAAIRAREGLRDLSAERIGHELRRLVIAPRAAETVELMQESGILPVVLGGVGYLAQFAKSIRARTAAGAEVVAATRLATLACRIEEDVVRIAGRLRLTNIERDRILAMLAATRALALFPDERAARRLLYRVGVEAFRDGVFHAFAWSSSPPGPAWKELYHLPDRWAAPVFPLGGRDIVGKGISGPAIGVLLRSLEAWWIDEDFVPSEAVLRGRLQQMMAAGQ